MDYYQAFFLGVIQGLTEFIPVSSSGHLFLAREFFGEHFAYDLAFDAVLQLATALAILVYFAKDILVLIKESVDGAEVSLARGKLWFIFVGTIPAVLVGLYLEPFMENSLRQPMVVAGALLLGSLVMYLAERHHRFAGEANAKRGLVVGLFQCLALIPGFSRSGMTISGGLLAGLSRPDAVRMSFLLAFPIIAGSGLKKLMDLGAEGLLSSLAWPLALSCLSAFVVGLWAIGFLLKYLKGHTFKAFIWYRVALALLVFLLI